PRQVESLLLKQPGAGPEYQLVLDRAAGGSDRLTLLLEVAEGFDAAAAGRLRSELKQQLHLSPEITLLKEGELPRAPGKAGRAGAGRRAGEWAARRSGDGGRPRPRSLYLMSRPARRATVVPRGSVSASSSNRRCQSYIGSNRASRSPGWQASSETPA